MYVQPSLSSFFMVFMVDHLLKTLSQASSVFATRIKRILFVFSVFGSLDTRYGRDHGTIKDINCRLHLSETPDVCSASANFAHCLWPRTHDRRKEDKPLLSIATNSTERELIVTYFIRRCPRWLRYGDPNMDDMRRDLQKLFKIVITRDAY